MKKKHIVPTADFENNKAGHDAFALCGGENAKK